MDISRSPSLAARPASKTRRLAEQTGSPINALWRSVASLCMAAGGLPLMAGLFAAPWFRKFDSWYHWAPRLDLLNNFIPIWVCLVALGLCILLVCRSPFRAMRWVASILFAAGAVPIVTEFAGSPARAEYSAAAQHGKNLRLIQFNALNSNSDPDAVLALVFEHDADFILVQEPERFQKLEPLFSSRYPFRTPCPNDRCKAVIYAQQPPLDSKYDVLLEDQPRAVSRLGIARMTIRGPDGNPLEILATHMRWPYPVGIARQQRIALLEYVQALDETRTILAGDFNLTPWTFEMRAFDEDMGAMHRVTRGLFTFPVPFSISDPPVPLPVLPIDHVYVGSRWLPVKVDLAPASGSDHFPIIVELAMDRV